MAGITGKAKSGKSVCGPPSGDIARESALRTRGLAQRRLAWLSVIIARCVMQSPLLP